MDFKAGTVLDSYRLKTCCGHGAYGSVFLAENLLTHETVALKVIKGADQTMRRELNGLINYQTIKSPFLLKVRHIGQYEDAFFYTMDPADNANPEGEPYKPETLAEKLQRQGRLTPEDLQDMLDQLLQGLQTLHEHGLVHRDIKPDNILFIQGQYVLGDIGLVTHSQGASLRGTPCFMSPQLLRNLRTALPQDDFYALAKVIYCASTGCPAENYPHLPENFPLATYAAFSKAMSVPCRENSPIHTADDFRALLPKPDAKTAGKHPLKTAGLLLAALILILIPIWSLTITLTQNNTPKTRLTDTETTNKSMDRQTKNGNPPPTMAEHKPQPPPALPTQKIADTKRTNTPPTTRPRTRTPFRIGIAPTANTANTITRKPVPTELASARQMGKRTHDTPPPQTKSTPSEN